MGKSPVPVGDEELAAIRSELRANPRDLAPANRYWEALGNRENPGGGAVDCRSGNYVVEAFREAALASLEGVVALARAQYELLTDIAGEPPMRCYIDDQLFRRLEEAAPSLSSDDYLVVFWVLGMLRLRPDEPPRPRWWEFWKRRAAPRRSRGPVTFCVGCVPGPRYAHVERLLAENGIPCSTSAMLDTRPRTPGGPEVRHLFVPVDDTERAAALVRGDAEQEGYELMDADPAVLLE